MLILTRHYGQTIEIGKPGELFDANGKPVTVKIVHKGNQGRYTSIGFVLPKSVSVMRDDAIVRIPLGEETPIHQGDNDDDDHQG